MSTELSEILVTDLKSNQNVIQSQICLPDNFFKKKHMGFYKKILWIFGRWSKNDRKVVKTVTNGHIFRA